MAVVVGGPIGRLDSHSEQIRVHSPPSKFDYGNQMGRVTFAILFYTGVAVAIMPAPGIASESRLTSEGRWYTAVKASLGDVTIDDISHFGTIGTGLRIGNDLDGRIKDRQTSDYTTGIGVAVGRRLGDHWTLEGELVWRYRTDWDISATTPSIETITNVFSDVSTTTVVINAIRRGAINQHWSWEIGAGVGVVYNDIAASYLERATPSVPEFKVRDNATETGFTFNVLGGVVRDLPGAWSLNIRWRYVELGDLSAGPFATRPARVSAEHSAHEVQFSVERSW